MKRNLNTLSVFAALLLSACGSGNGTGQNTPQSSNAFSESRLVAEKTGAIPVLDRTTSLLGTDADGNGVRDDIDAYINSLPDTALQKKALKQVATSLTETLTVDTLNPTAVSTAVTNSMNSIRCISAQYGDNGYKSAKTIEKYTINTKERFVVYMKFNQEMSGKVWPMPAKGVNCAP